MVNAWYYVFQGIEYFLSALSWCIVINALLSWFMEPGHPIRLFLDRLTYPFVAPFRKIAMRIARNLPIDLSPFFALFALQLLTVLVNAIGVRVGMNFYF